MAFALAASDTDDPEFLACISSLIDGVTDDKDFRELHLVHLDNWFDHKWLGFSGQVAGGAGVWKKDERLTIPAFHPNRVLAQRFFARPNKTTALEESPTTTELHREQASNRNLQRHVAVVAESAAFLWYSGNTQANGRGAVMAYLPIEGGYETWYGSLVRREGWVVDKTKQISKAVLAALCARGSVTG